ncbi:MAG: hemerythrin domain-containing protein, partial [Myxococcales bacterium]|nr:hemerythrin domain-containing protein [Myxococcales bacterium]
RTAILEQHRGLRDGLAEIQGEALGLLSGSKGTRAQLLAHLTRLVARLEGHMGFEDERLVPVLRTIDAWGPERVERFRDEHERQRRILDSLLSDSEKADEVQLALLTLGFVQLLRIDMDEEEATMLSADLLRDDPITMQEAE